MQTKIWITYKPDIDKFREWDIMMPTHWIKLPDNPKEYYFLVY